MLKILIFNKTPFLKHIFDRFHKNVENSGKIAENEPMIETRQKSLFFWNFNLKLERFSSQIIRENHQKTRLPLNPQPHPLSHTHTHLPYTRPVNDYKSPWNSPIAPKENCCRDRANPHLWKIVKISAKSPKHLKDEPVLVTEIELEGSDSPTNFIMEKDFKHFSEQFSWRSSLIFSKFLKILPITTPNYPGKEGRWEK